MRDQTLVLRLSMMKLGNQVGISRNFEISSKFRTLIETVSQLSCRSNDLHYTYTDCLSCKVSQSETKPPTSSTMET